MRELQPIISREYDSYLLIVSDWLDAVRVEQPRSAVTAAMQSAASFLQSLACNLVYLYPWSESSGGDPFSWFSGSLQPFQSNQRGTVMLASGLFFPRTDVTSRPTYRVLRGLVSATVPYRSVRLVLQCSHARLE